MSVSVEDTQTTETEHRFILDPSGVEDDGTADPQPDRCETIGCESEFVGSGRCQECVDVTPVPKEDSYEDVDFTLTWEYTPSDLQERKQWMGATIVDDRKLPFAPWADSDHPEVNDDDDARWKWSIQDNYVDGDTVDSQLSESAGIEERSFIQLGDDPFAHVDFDKVVDETGSVHPAVAPILDRLGRSFTELSVSETGIHAIYFGELPDGVTEATWDLDDELWGSNNELPSIEIYDGTRNLVITGTHVRGTLAGVHEWDDDALYEILEENDQITHVSTPNDAVDFDAEEYEPEVTGRSETTEIQDVWAALDRLDTQRVAQKTIVHSWNGSASTSSGVRAFHPTWSPNNSGTANIITENGWDYTGGGGYGGPVVMALLDLGEVNPNTVTPRKSDVGGRLWFKGVDHLRNLGFDIPELVDSTDSVNSTEGDTEGDPIPEPRSCDPPELKDRVPFNAEKEREKLENEEYEAFIESERPVVWAHPPGWGKTTSAGLGGFKRDRLVAPCFGTHRKAREFINDDATPDNIFHLKGGGQPKDSSHIGAENDEGPLMCPLFERDEDDPLRQKFDYLEGLMGSIQAHNEIDPHDGEKCEWIKQYDEQKPYDRMACVHEHQVIKEISDNWDVLVDESTRLMKTEHTATVEELLNVADELERLNSVDPNYGGLADFARRLAESIRVDSEPDIEPPSMEWSNEPDVSRAETLASLRIGFNEQLRSRVNGGGDPSAKPGVIDVLIGFAGSCGLDAEACGKALSGPKTLHQCPRCGSRFSNEQGNRVCQNDECGWTEGVDPYLPPDAETARFNTYQDTTPSGYSKAVIELLPNLSELPDSPLLLDATATPKKIEGLYGTEPTVVGGDHNVQMNMNVTQITDGAYHKSTIKGNDALQRKFQSIIDWACNKYDKPLFGAKRDVLGFFEFAENAETVHYGGLRGLNYPECDAVFALGGPHWHVDDLTHKAELLSGGIAIDNGIEVGGVEYSARRTKNNEYVDQPPEYRKLQYVDDDGRGLELPVKEFSGLVGDLFYEKRESELEQLVHRTRPITSDETIDVYLLTNIVTETPVDELTELDILVEQAKGRNKEVAEMNIPADAKDLYEDLSSDETFTRSDIYERVDVSESTAKKWVNSLKDHAAIKPTGDTKLRSEILTVVN